jgi:drug/metabolite transporter (DMT)-like permease
MEALRIALYALASLTSLACTVLLVRAYRRQRYRLLLWSAACFACLTINNVILFFDLILLPNVDLRLGRLIAALAGIGCMLYGFIWEAE